MNQIIGERREGRTYRFIIKLRQIFQIIGERREGRTSSILMAGTFHLENNNVELAISLFSLNHLLAIFSFSSLNHVMQLVQETRKDFELGIHMDMDESLGLGLSSVVLPILLSGSSLAYSIVVKAISYLHSSATCPGPRQTERGMEICLDFGFGA
ncbi:hypothetical protein ACJX0J_036853, partial [Zea mays]